MRLIRPVSIAAIVLSVLAVAGMPVETRGQGAPSVGSAGPHGVAVFDVRTFGAGGDGRRLDTAGIQAAIDACHRAGGGTVAVPQGRYLTGTLFLKSNVELHLAVSATILGSTDPTHYSPDVARCGFVDFPTLDKCLIYAAGAENVRISGQGTIDGQGRSFPPATPDAKPGPRPMLMRLADCKKVSIEGVTLQNAAAWCAHFLGCSGVRIAGVTIFNRANYNNDGIDLMNTENVHISDCTLLCEDDCICFQDMSHDRPVQNITITNCRMSTRWAAIRSGGAHRGGIRNVTVSNCVIHDTYGCGIKLQISGNGSMEDMTFSNIVMTNVTSPISLRFGNHHFNNEKRDPAFPFGRMRNILFSNIRASVIDEASLNKALPDFYKNPAAKPYPGEQKQCISICGIPGHPVEGITLSEVHVTFPGGGTKEEGLRRDFPELEDQYPEYFMWGVLPAYGLYARHVKGLTLSNVRFDLARADARPAMVCDDTEDVDLLGFRADGSREAQALICLRSTRGALIQGCRPLGDVAAIVHVEGSNSRGIGLSGGDFRRAKAVVRTADGAGPRAVELLDGLPRTKPR